MRRALFTAAALLCTLALFFFGGSLFPLETPVKAAQETAGADVPEIPPEPPGVGTGPAVSAEPEPEPEPEYFTISMIGDITPDSIAAYDGSPYSYQAVIGDDYASVFASTLHYFKNDDFTIANFECVLSDSRLYAQDKNFTFSAPASYANILTEGSVEFVTLGNNHTMDYGERGYEDTRAALEAAGVAYAGRDEYILYETESGLLVGVYALSFGYASQAEAGIKALRDAGAEFIIAALHWGDEGSYKVNANQLALGRAAIDAGADVVYGSHPHTLQPVEEYNGHYIFYSMGNWSFGGNTNPRDKDTAIARLTVMRDLDGTVSVTGMTLIPCASSGVKNGNDYRPVPYETGSEEYLRTLSKLDGSYTGQDLAIDYEYNFSEY